MLNEKLLNEIEVVKRNIEGVNKILSMRSVNQADIANLKQRVGVLLQPLRLLGGKFEPRNHGDYHATR